MNNKDRLFTPIGHGYSPCQGASHIRYEIQEWITKLTWIWQPSRVIELKAKSQGEGFVWTAGLTDNLIVCIGVDRQGIQLCALLQEMEGLIWDRKSGLCGVQSFSMNSPQDAESFTTQMEPILRRNCFLAGAQIDATAEERYQWIRWLACRASEVNPSA